MQPSRDCGRRRYPQRVPASKVHKALSISCIFKFPNDITRIRAGSGPQCSKEREKNTFRGLKVLLHSTRYVQGAKRFQELKLMIEQRPKCKYSGKMCKLLLSRCQKTGQLPSSGLPSPPPPSQILCPSLSSRIRQSVTSVAPPPVLIRSVAQDGQDEQSDVWDGIMELLVRAKDESR